MECNTIGERIAHLRNVKGISQSDLAKAMYVKREVVTHWEVGDRDLKTEYTIKLADYFGVTCDYLLRGIKAENVNIAKATGLGDQAIEKLKKISALTAENKLPNLEASLNGFINSDHFLSFLLTCMRYKNKSAELEERLDIFKEWLVQHEEKPPKRLLEYAAQVACENPLSPAVEIMQCRADHQFVLFQLHNCLDKYAADVQKEA